MKVGDLVRVPSWQLKRNFWSNHCDFGSGIILETTPYVVRVHWSNGHDIVYEHSKAACLEVIR